MGDKRWMMDTTFLDPLVFIEPLMVCHTDCKEERQVDREKQYGPTIQEQIVSTLLYVREERLPTGPSQFTRAEVEQRQRRRLISALAESVRRHGYKRTTVRHIIELSGVSRRAFYELFCDKYDCFIAALRAAGCAADTLAIATTFIRIEGEG